MIDIHYLKMKKDLIQDPFQIFTSLTSNGTKKNCLLLESGEPGENHSQQSILIVQSALIIKLKQGNFEFQALTENGKNILKAFDTGSFDVITRTDTKIILKYQPFSEYITLSEKLNQPSIFSPLRSWLQQCVTHDEHSAKALMLAGLLSFDLIDYFEEEVNMSQIGISKKQAEDIYLMVPETRIVINHVHQNYTIEQLVVNQNENVASYNQAKSDLKTCFETINQTQKRIDLSESSPETKHFSVKVDIEQKEFEVLVEKAKQKIIEGEIFQVVPSRTFSCLCPNPLYAYQKLTQHNPSPYQFYCVMDDAILFGASPESAVKYNSKSGEVEIYPIAGTAPRGRNEKGIIDPDLDNRLEAHLRLDQKELSEHMMLVDLARNDIARISKSGTRQVKELLKVDKYSQVMHLVSRVSGELESNLDAFHAYQSCLNMGTLTGAPKIRATQIIRELEQHKRGFYGGAIGYFNKKGDLDSAIIIRSAFVKDGSAFVTAGAGIVADSIPAKEAHETSNKAAAVLRAIADVPVEDLYI